MSQVLEAIVATGTYKFVLDNWQAHFHKNYGWRAGDAYVERGASVADVVEYEIHELENDLALHAPPEVLIKFLAKNAMWLCPTRKAASSYGTPHKVGLSQDAFIAASDDDNGYLVVDTGE